MVFWLCIVVIWNSGGYLFVFKWYVFEKFFFYIVYDLLVLYVIEWYLKSIGIYLIGEIMLLEKCMGIVLGCILDVGNCWRDMFFWEKSLIISIIYYIWRLWFICVYRRICVWSWLFLKIKILCIVFFRVILNINISFILLKLMCINVY